MRRRYHPQHDARWVIDALEPITHALKTVDAVQGLDNALIHASQDEKTALRSGTAQRIYRLKI